MLYRLSLLFYYVFTFKCVGLSWHFVDHTELGKTTQDIFEASADLRRTAPGVAQSSSMGSRLSLPPHGFKNRLACHPAASAASAGLKIEHIRISRDFTSRSSQVGTNWAGNVGRLWAI